mmetsp:Transcript_12717/g.30151  ORF Transcript_12717/g.30151 Transcript_12717/m.30151 type:complete len:240 (+) Transcript_12717:63-782(+)
MSFLRTVHSQLRSSCHSRCLDHFIAACHRLSRDSSSSLAPCFNSFSQTPQDVVSFTKSRYVSGYGEIGRSFATSTTPQHVPQAKLDPANLSVGNTALSCSRQYEIIGRIEGPYEVEVDPKFAIVEVGAHQFKVAPGDLIITEKLRDVDVNDKLKLHSILLLGSTSETIIGRPLVPGASVTAAVEEQFLDAKKLIFKKRRRKDSKRLKGHRQPLTTLRILEVNGFEAALAQGETRDLSSE